MFGLFGSSPPLAPFEKAWTEYRMNWFASHFGASRLLETPTLPPDYSGIPTVSNFDQAQDLLKFLQTWMKIESCSLKLQLYSNVVSPDSIKGPDDSKSSTVVEIQEDDFAHRDTLVAAMARGLAKAAIKEHGLAEQLVGDNNWTTELLPAYLGLGAFSANATVEDSSFSNGSYSEWNMSRRGVLPSRIFGYAMALRTFVKGDDDYPWSVHLRQDAAVAFDKGMKYLKKTGDTTFDRDRLEQPPETNTLISDLENGSAARQINALWDLSQRVEAKALRPDNDLGELVLSRLHHRETDVRASAIRVLPNFVRNEPALLEVCEALGDHKPDVRAEAARIAGLFTGIDDESMVESLMTALADDSRLVAFNAANSLRLFGEAAQPAIKGIIKRIHRSFVDCNDDDGLQFASALLAIDPDARKQFENVEKEFRRYVNEVFDQLENQNSH